jgi:hypothetical protein
MGETFDHGVQKAIDETEATKATQKPPEVIDNENFGTGSFCGEWLDVGAALRRDFGAAQLSSGHKAPPTFSKRPSTNNFISCLL